MVQKCGIAPAADRGPLANDTLCVPPRRNDFHCPFLPAPRLLWADRPATEGARCRSVSALDKHWCKAHVSESRERDLGINGIVRESVSAHLPPFFVAQEARAIHAQAALDFRWRYGLYGCLRGGGIVNVYRCRDVGRSVLDSAPSDAV